MTHVLPRTPGDALLPWAAAEPQQRRGATPQVSGLGTPSAATPGPQEVRRELGKRVCPAWQQRDGQRAQGRRNLGFGCSCREHRDSGGTRTGSARGLSSPAGGCIGRAVQSRGCVHSRQPLCEGEPCYSTGRQNISGEPAPDAALGVLLRQCASLAPCKLGSNRRAWRW